MNNFYAPDADGSGRLISSKPPTDLKPGEISVRIDGQWTPLKFLLGLKVENTQLAAENKRLREGLEFYVGDEGTYDDSVWQHCITEELLENIPNSETGWQPAFTYAKEVLQTPTTPGLGAAMLRVVKAAQKDVDELANSNSYYLLQELYEAVQALNEMESK